MYSLYVQRQFLKLFVTVDFYIAAEGVTSDNFWVMTEETLKTVVPRAGPRALLLSKIKAVRI